MIFVDTSVWVAALRATNSEEGRRLRALLEQDEVGLPIPVRLEILSGASGRDRERLRATLSALPEYVPDERTWTRLDGWIERAAEAGRRFSVMDLLIAALAADHRASIWSLDKAFEQMARLEMVDLHRPAGQGPLGI